MPTTTHHIKLLSNDLMLSAVKQISAQKTSSITVLNFNKLLVEAKVPRTLMGYDSWGNFSFSQVLYVIDGIGYIARRTRDNQNAPITIKRTVDGVQTTCGYHLQKNEKIAFHKLGLSGI
ncbi:hypothetical protein BST55_23970 [Vibrio vulnificus]|nr:hypothetical protein BST52_24030 [Vibrio vulnificus]PAO24268.1 hypothetical protein BTT96_23360 [Vibrio vulnificus]PAO50498.1 hypothetical protein BST55_23970 [Vibrio vulnificus]